MEENMRKYISLLLISLILTMSIAAASIVQTPENYHKPKIRAGTSSGYSLNWAGYALDGPVGSVNDVKGSWVVPTVTCAKKQYQYSAFWIGIDGDNSSTVEQTGTSSDCRRGTPVYYAWHEFYPAYPVNIATSDLSVSPGNIMSAEVSYSGSTGLFTVSITNQNTSQTYSATGTVSNAQRNSAEWIAEAPSSGSVLPLANFGTAYFGLDYTGIPSTSFATVNGITGNIGSFAPATNVNVNTIGMVSFSGRPKAIPSVLAPDGTSFSVRWYRS